jgi:hypothetical protein
MILTIKKMLGPERKDVLDLLLAQGESYSEFVPSGVLLRNF